MKYLITGSHVGPFQQGARVTAQQLNDAGLSPEFVLSKGQAQRLDDDGAVIAAPLEPQPPIASQVVLSPNAQAAQEAQDQASQRVAAALSAQKEAREKRDSAQNGGDLADRVAALESKVSRLLDYMQNLPETLHGAVKEIADQVEGELSDLKTRVGKLEGEEMPEESPLDEGVTPAEETPGADGEKTGFPMAGTFQSDPPADLPADVTATGLPVDGEPSAPVSEVVTTPEGEAAGVVIEDDGPAPRTRKTAAKATEKPAS